MWMESTLYGHWIGIFAGRPGRVHLHGETEDRKWHACLVSMGPTHSKADLCNYHNIWEGDHLGSICRQPGSQWPARKCSTSSSRSWHLRSQPRSAHESEPIQRRLNWSRPNHVHWRNCTGVRYDRCPEMINTVAAWKEVFELGYHAFFNF